MFLRVTGSMIHTMNANFAHAFVFLDVVVERILVFTFRLHAFQWAIAEYRRPLFTASPKPCTSKAIMAIAPTMINIRRKSCIIIFSVVLTPCHHGKHLLTKVFVDYAKCKCTLGFHGIKMNKIVLFAVFRTFLNSLTLNNPVRYAKFTRAYITRVCPDHGFIICSRTSQRPLLLFTGMEAHHPTGHSSLCHPAFAGEYPADGRRILVAIHTTR